MRRRDFIKVTVGSAASWPLAGRAQQPRRVGVLMTLYSQTDREGQASIAAFLDTFQRLGWTDGRNVRIEYRWAGDAERQKAAAEELVHSAPDAIVAAGSPALADLQRLTSTTPIVFTQVGDPVAAGFVTSLARPGGNVTGLQGYEPAMGGKWLGVLKEAVPNLRRAAVLFSPDCAASVAYQRAAEVIAPKWRGRPTLGLEQGAEEKRAKTHHNARLLRDGHDLHHRRVGIGGSEIEPEV